DESVYAFEIQAGDAELPGCAAPGARGQRPKHVRNGAGHESIATVRRTALPGASHADDVVARDLHGESQVGVLVKIVVVDEVELVPALVENSNRGVEARRRARGHQVEHDILAGFGMEPEQVVIVR